MKTSNSSRHGKSSNSNSKTSISANYPVAPKYDSIEYFLDYSKKNIGELFSKLKDFDPESTAKKVYSSRRDNESRTKLKELVKRFYKFWMRQCVKELDTRAVWNFEPQRIYHIKILGFPLILIINELGSYLFLNGLVQYRKSIRELTPRARRLQRLSKFIETKLPSKIHRYAVAMDFETDHNLLLDELLLKGQKSVRVWKGKQSAEYRANQLLRDKNVTVKSGRTTLTVYDKTEKDSLQYPLSRIELSGSNSNKYNQEFFKSEKTKDSLLVRGRTFISKILPAKSASDLLAEAFRNPDNVDDLVNA
jgi:hypothetical protein